MCFKKTRRIKLTVLLLIIILSVVTERYVFCEENGRKVSTAKKIDYMEEINRLGIAGRPESLNASGHYNEALKTIIKWEAPLTLSDIKNWPADLTDEKRRLLEEWIASNEYAVKQLEKGTQKPYYWFKYNSSAIEPALQSPIFIPGKKVLSIVCALCSKAKLAAMKKDFEKGFSDLLTCYKFGLHLTGPKSLDEQIVGIAVRGTMINATFQILDKNKGEIPSDVLKNFQQKLYSIQAGMDKPIDFTFEKFFIYHTIQQMFDPNNKGKTETFLKKSKMMDTLTPQEKAACEKADPCEMVVLGNAFLGYLENIDYGTILWQLHDNGEDLEAVVRDITKTNSVISDLAGAMCGALTQAYRSKMDIEALITTLAILRYRSDKGQLPESLNILIKVGYLESLPADPYHNGPLVYNRIGDSFFLYSFGPDFADNGGSVRYHQQEKDKRGDVVFWPVESN